MKIEKHRFNNEWQTLPWYGKFVRPNKEVWKIFWMRFKTVRWNILNGRDFPIKENVLSPISLELERKSEGRKWEKKYIRLHNLWKREIYISTSQRNMKGNRTEKLKNCENYIRKIEKRYGEMKKSWQKREKEYLLINNVCLIWRK